MLITRTSQATGITRTMDLPVTKEQIVMWATTSALVQDVFPNLSNDQREFIMTGITADEWDQIYADMDEHQRSEFDDIPF